MIVEVDVEVETVAVATAGTGGAVRKEVGPSLPAAEAVAVAGIEPFILEVGRNVSRPPLALVLPLTFDPVWTLFPG